MSEQKDRALTIKEVAEFLNISNQMVYNLIKAEEIEAFKIGSAVRILFSDLSRYVNAQKTSFKARGEQPVGSDELLLTGVTANVGDFQLKAFTAAFRGGKINAVIGECASGKTTLLRCIAGLQDYTGEILLGGEDVQSIDTKKRRIGFLFQNQRLFPYVSGKKNITFQTSDTISDEELSQMLTECGLSPDNIDLTKDARQIPPGIRQLALIVRKKMQQFSVLLLDDPFKNIEPHVRKYVTAIIRSMSDIHGMTVVIACTDVRDAAGLADFVTIIEGGSLAQSGEMSEVYRNPCSENTMRLLSYFPVNFCNVDISNGIAVDYNLSAPVTEGKMRLGFRADEIEVTAEGVRVETISEQFYDGRKKIVRVKCAASVEYDLLVSADTASSFCFTPIHPVFFAAE